MSSLFFDLSKNSSDPRLLKTNVIPFLLSAKNQGIFDFLRQKRKMPRPWTFVLGGMTSFISVIPKKIQSSLQKRQFLVRGSSTFYLSQKRKMPRPRTFVLGGMTFAYIFPLLKNIFVNKKFCQKTLDIYKYLC